MKKHSLEMKRRVASKAQKGLHFRRKLSLLRALSGSKSVSEEGIIADTINRIVSLMHQIESLKKHLKERREVRVEKAGQGFMVNVKCGKDGDNSSSVITSILQVFQDLNLSVTQASIACQGWFSMKALVVADQDLCITVQDLTGALAEAIHYD